MDDLLQPPAASRRPWRATAGHGLLEQTTIRPKGAESSLIRKPLSIGPEQWLTRAQIGEEFQELLPKGETTFDWETIAELERAFGPQGEFPVQQIN